MRKLVLLTILTLGLPTDSPAIPTKDAFAECRVRIEKFLELNRTNKEVAFTSVFAMSLLAGASDQVKKPEDAIKIFLNMLMAQCVEGLKNEERA